MTTVTFNDFCDNIPDLRENIQNGTVKVIPLKKGMKAPRDNGWSKKDYTLSDIENSNTNLGIMPGYNHTESSLAIIDIDGYTMNKVNAEEKQYYKEATQKFLYECLKDIPGAMIVRTQSGGFHIYLWNRTVNEHIHETSNNLHFPDNFYIEELQSKSLKHSIEIFTKGGSKQCLLPGCIVYDKDTGKENDYIILSEVNSLNNIATVDDIHQTVIDTLLAKGFTYHKNEKTTDKTVPDNIKYSNELKQLSNLEIQNAAELVSPLIEKIDGQKHTGCLYLGGYFSRNITAKSTNHVANAIIKRIGHLFDDSGEFKKTLLKNYNKSDDYKGGLPKFCEIVESIDPTFNTSKFIFEMNKICRLNFVHSFLSKKYHDNKKKYIDINFASNKISTHTWNRTKIKNEDGTSEWTTSHIDTYDIANMSPVDIFETYNILDKNASPKLCFTFYRNGMPSKQTIEGDDIQIIEKQLERRPGIVLKPREYKGLLNEVINEYIKLEQIHIIEEIPVPGIFCNPLNGNLARADEHNAVEINLPSRDEVSQAVGIWEDLEDVYPGDHSKLAHILRWGLMSPFSYILKTRFVWLPMLFLYGASRTSKTTLAEISLSPYSKITSEISIGGGAFNTEYRIGYALSRQGIGTIINEPSATINNDVYCDLLKRCVESGISREKNDRGIHTKVPCYSNMCFTSNSFLPTNDAFVRRADYLEFTKNERLSNDDIKLFSKTFKHQNWNNTRFLELKPIGDYITYYIAQDVNVLGNNHYDTVFGMINSLFAYIGEKPFSWLYEMPELMDIGASDKEVLSEFRRLILRDYKDLTKNSSKIYENAFENVASVDDDFNVTHSRHHGDFAKLLRAVIESNNISYLHYSEIKHQQYVLVNTSVKNALNDFNGLQITCKGLADYMGFKYDTYSYKGNKIKAFRMLFSEFINFLYGGFEEEK